MSRTPTRLLLLLSLFVLFLALPPSHVYAADQCVNTGGTGGCHTTIAAAIAAANPGDTVTISGETFTEGSITVDKAITIQGAGAGSTIINAASTQVFTIAADDVILQDLTITSAVNWTDAIRIAGASNNLTVDGVHITNLTNGSGNAFGINITNSFTGLTVRNSRFEAGGLGSYTRTIPIFSGNNMVVNNVVIENNVFTNHFVGIYFRTTVNNMTIQGNTFGPQELDDCHAAAAGIYIGDGSVGAFNLDDINITNNNFNHYCRGVYVWNYATGETVDAFSINNNVFTDSIYSAGIRMMSVLDAATNRYSILEGPITISGNTFTQSGEVGAAVGLIDIRAYLDSPTSTLNITNNDITFSSGPYTDAMFGVILRGSTARNINVTGNTMAGNNIGGTSSWVDSSGIFLATNYSPDYGNFNPATAFNMSGNDISGFSNGIAVWDVDNGVPGGLPQNLLVNATNTAFNNSPTNLLNGDRVTDGYVDLTGSSFPVPGPTGLYMNYILDSYQVITPDNCLVDEHFDGRINAQHGCVPFAVFSDGAGGVEVYWTEGSDYHKGALIFTASADQVAAGLAENQGSTEETLITGASGVNLFAKGDGWLKAEILGGYGVDFSPALLGSAGAVPSSTDGLVMPLTLPQTGGQPVENVFQALMAWFTGIFN